MLNLKHIGFTTSQLNFMLSQIFESSEFSYVDPIIFASIRIDDFEKFENLILDFAKEDKNLIDNRPDDNWEPDKFPVAIIEHTNYYSASIIYHYHDHPINISLISGKSDSPDFRYKFFDTRLEDNSMQFRFFGGTSIKFNAEDKSSDVSPIEHDIIRKEFLNMLTKK